MILNTSLGKFAHVTFTCDFVHHFSGGGSAYFLR